jgi:hypothetical protein
MKPGEPPSPQRLRADNRPFPRVFGVADHNELRQCAKSKLAEFCFAGIRLVVMYACTDEIMETPALWHTIPMVWLRVVPHHWNGMPQAIFRAAFVLQSANPLAIRACCGIPFLLQHHHEILCTEAAHVAGDIATRVDRCFG